MEGYEEPVYQNEVKRTNRKFLRLAFVVIVLALFCSVCYIVYDKYSEYQLMHDYEIAQQGFDYGANQTMLFIMQEVAQCKQVPLTMYNQTLNIVAVECLQQGAQNG